MNLPKLILASGSPRRAEILNFVGWEFEKHVADIDETHKKGEKPAEYVQRLAQEKAEAVALHYENTLVLGADTIVLIDDKIIGKPVDSDDARKMLKTLSGRWHEVLTGVAIVKNSRFKIQDSKLKTQNSKEEMNNNQQSIVDFQATKVKFNKLNDEEIEFLVQKGEPLDKAGAYAVQAQAALFIEKIEGDYWNVVGLPINLVYDLVKGFS